MGESVPAAVKAARVLSAEAARSALAIASAAGCLESTLTRAARTTC